MSEQGASRFEHPQSAELWTPVTPELMTLIHRMRLEWGTWREVSAQTGVRLRVLRHVHQANRKAISLSLLDRLISGTRMGDLRDFPWFTADDLVELGIWEPVVHFGNGQVDSRRDLTPRERLELSKAKKKAKRAKERAKRRKRRGKREGGR
jgi:hypothetical protein